MKNKWHIETRLIAELIPHPKNPRQFTEKGMKDLGRSIDAFGLAEPVVVNTDNTIIGGHARVKVLQMKGETKCECYVPDRQLSEKEVEQLMIRLNANQAGVWNTERLANEWDLSELMDWGLDLPEFRNLEAQEDDYVIPDEIVTDIKRGDIFQIGEHFLMCGDSTKAEDVGRLMNGEKPDMVFADAPYGISVVRNKTIGGGGIVRANNYSEIIGDETTETAKKFYELCIKLGMKNFILWGGNYFTDFLPPSRCWICWDKIDGIEGTTKNFSDIEIAWTNYNKPSRIVRHRWQGLLKASEHKEKRIHPTQKPIALVNECFNLFEVGNLIYDGFLGSGTTMVAAEQLNRRCFGMEISPQYCQVIIDRMKKSFPDIEIKRNGITCDMNDLKQKDVSLPV